MLYKKNCWEFQKCGREPGGQTSEKHGVCPATVNTATHGINDGINGGRACWIIEGTQCEGERQGSYAQKIGKCMKCDFYATVRQEQGEKYNSSREIIRQLDPNKNRSNEAGLATAANSK